MKQHPFRLRLPHRLVSSVQFRFAVTFTIYFFNLDMKLLSAFEPILLRHYDRIPRNQHL